MAAKKKTPVKLPHVAAASGGTSPERRGGSVAGASGGVGSRVAAGAGMAARGRVRASTGSGGTKATGGVRVIPKAAPKAAAPTVAAAPVKHTNTAPPPYLTPDEQRAWENYQGKYEDLVGNRPGAIGGQLGQELAQGQSNYTSGMGDAKHTHDVNSNTENQNDAARGIFLSSIRDGDLNDIDSTLAVRQGMLNTAWSNLQIKVGSEYNSAVRDYGTTDSYYRGLSVSNAMGSDPGTQGDGSTPPAPTAAAAPSAATTPGAVTAASGMGGTAATGGVRAIPKASTPTSGMGGVGGVRALPKSTPTSGMGGVGGVRALPKSGVSRGSA